MAALQPKHRRIQVPNLRQEPPEDQEEEVEEVEEVPVIEDDEDYIGNLNPSQMMDYYVMRLFSIKGITGAKDSALELFHSLMYDFCEHFSELKNGGLLKRNAHFLRRKAVKNVPQVKSSVHFEEKNEAGDFERKVVDNLKAIPKRLLSDSATTKLLRFEAIISLKDLVEHVKKLHGDDFFREGIRINLSADGVPETDSGKKTLKIVSLTFEGCGRPYPLHILNPFKGKASLTAEETLRYVIDEIKSLPGVQVLRFIADTPERGLCLGLKGHMAYYGCSWCEAPGVNKFNARRYGPSTADAPRRTLESVVEIAKNLENLQSYEEQKGVKLLSPLVELKEAVGFDMIKDSPVEIMHAIDFGVCKDMMERLLEGKEGKILQEVIDQDFLQMKTLSEHARRPRTLIQLAKFKSSEFAFLLSSFFLPLFNNLLDVESNYEEDVWLCLRRSSLLLVFINRLALYNDEEYRAACEGIDTEQILREFYKDWEKGWNRKVKEECKINLHFIVHLFEVRKGSAAESSAERFEASYFAEQRCYAGGTPNIPKQLLENYLVRDTIMHRCCVNRRPVIKTYKQSTKTTDDSIVRLEDGEFYRVRELNGTSATVTRIITCDFYPDVKLDLPALPWDRVGVKIFSTDTEEEAIMIDVRDVKGKGVIAGDFLVEYQVDWLQSKLM